MLKRGNNRCDIICKIVDIDLAVPQEILKQFKSFLLIVLAVAKL